MSGMSYTEHMRPHLLRRLEYSRRRFEALSDAVNDVLIFDTEPDLRVGQVVEHRGRKMMVAQMASPSDTVTFELGKDFAYSNWAHAKHSALVVPIEEKYNV